MVSFVTGGIGSLGNVGLAGFGASQALDFGGDRIRDFSAFDQQIRDVITLAPQAESAINQFFSGADRLAQQFGQNIERVTSGIYDTVSATGEWERSLGRVTEAGILAIGGQTTIDVAAQGILTGYQAFGTDDLTTSNQIAESVRVGRLLRKTDLSRSQPAERE